MAQRGGKRPGAGRKKGSANRASPSEIASLSALARSHAAVAMKTLVDVAKSGESEAARVTAANAILDRGYGKPAQSHEHSGPRGGPIATMDVTNLTDAQLNALYAALGGSADAAGGDEDARPGGDSEAQG
jgi:hypothetical protein